ncbi:MAG TPA: hypothetical protein VGM50_18395, partial [Gemmatimonadaceae bacterium]
MLPHGRPLHTLNRGARGAPTFSHPMFLRRIPASLTRIVSRSAAAMLCLSVVMTGCKKETVTATKLPTLNVERGDINVRVQATGTVEPINPVDVKSKAG